MLGSWEGISGFLKWLLELKTRTREKEEEVIVLKERNAAGSTLR